MTPHAEFNIKIFKKRNLFFMTMADQNRLYKLDYKIGHSFVNKCETLNIFTKQ